MLLTKRVGYVFSNSAVAWSRNSTTLGSTRQHKRCWGADEWRYRGINKHEIDHAVWLCVLQTRSNYTGRHTFTYNIDEANEITSGIWKNIARHSANTIISEPDRKKWLDSYFRFDDDNKMKYKYSHNNWREMGELNAVIPSKSLKIIESMHLNTLRPKQNGWHSLMIYSNAFSWLKIYEFRLIFHRNVFPRVQLTISQRRCR